MKCRRFEFRGVKTLLLSLAFAISSTAIATTIEVDADGGATLLIDNIATNAQTLLVGTDNGGNSLIVTNSGSVTVDSASIGSTSFGNNTVLVTGSNSYMQAKTDLNIGISPDSTGNELTVSDNGWVYVGDMTTNNPLGSGISVGATNETVTLSIGSGSTVDADNLLIGTQSNATGLVSLSGSDTSLSLANDLQLGTISSDNSLSVSNGAVLTIENDLLIGSASNTNNHLTVSSGGSVAILGTTTINNTSNNSINVNSGGRLSLSQGLDLDDDNDGYNINNGAALELNGTLLADKLDYNIDVTLSGTGTTWTTASTHMYIGDLTNGNELVVQDGAAITNTTGKLYVGNNSDFNKLVISGTNSSLETQGESFVGNNGSGNTLSVTNGGDAHMVGTLKIGNGLNANNNAINVSNSQLTADTNIIVGVKGDNNTLTADNGAQVSIGGSFIVGEQSNGNAVNISSNNTMVTVQGSFVAGDQGENNTLNMSGGQLVVSNNFTLGSGGTNNRYFQTGGTNTVAGEFIIGATSNATGVTTIGATDTSGNLGSVGTNATLDIKQNLVVGKEGGGSILLINDGGKINVDGDAIIGEASDDNYIFLQRGNSNNFFHVENDLVVGKDGGNNRFAIYSGTADIDGNLYLGNSTNQHELKNYIHLNGTNTELNIANEFHVGASNSINTLDLRAGATVYAQDLFVGAYEGVSNNVVTVTGNDDDLLTYVADSLLSVSNNLVIGSNTGSNNVVNIDHGGILSVLNPTNIVIGATATNDLNNRLNINSGGTLQTINWDYGTVSTNIVLNSGSTLELDGTFSGTNELDGGIELVLNGTAAATNWSTSTNILRVGSQTGGNTLMIKEGAFVTTSTNLIVGSSSESANNTLTATGLSSRVEIGNNLVVGNTGSLNNALKVLGGGRVDVGNDMILGYKSSFNSGSLIEGFAGVGSNSVLDIAGKLTVGSGANGDNNTLNVSSNATVNVGDTATIGNNADGNTLNLSGSNSVFNIGNSLVVGSNGGSGNNMGIANGAAVNVANSLTLGSNGSGNTISLRGLEDAQSSLSITNNLRIGSSGGNGNTFNISDNATLEVGGPVSIGNNADGNTLGMSGTNSMFSVGGSMSVGSNGGSFNSFGLSGGGETTIANNLTVGSDGDNNNVSLSGIEGDQSNLSITNNLTIGSSEGAGNTFTVSDYATANVLNLTTVGSDAYNNTLRLEGADAVLNVGSNLLVGTKTATGNKLEILEGTANIDSSLIIGSHSNSANNAALVSGSNSTLNVGGNLVVGEDGSGNSLSITNGATAHIVGDAWIGLNSANNWIAAYGSNSQLVIDNDLYVGSTNETSSGNGLGVYSGASIFVGGNLSLATNGLIYITYDSQITVDGDYEQGELSTLRVSLSTNDITTNLVVNGTANLEKDTTIFVVSDGTITALVDADDNTNEVARTIVAAGSLQIDEQDATTALLHSSINFQTNALLGFTYTVTNNTILLDNFIKRSWAEAAELEGMLADVANEIEGLTSNELAQAMDITFQGMSGQEINKAMDDYYGEKMSSAPMHNVVNQGIGSIASELTVRGDNTRDRITAPVPGGAAGPHRWNQELQGWIAGYGTLGSKSEASGFDGYDVSLGGFIIGADFAASENILVGVAGGSNSGSIDKDNGADGDTKTTYGAIYASLGTKDWFLDGSVIYGTSSIDNTLGDVFDTKASYDAKNIAFYLGGGKEIVGTHLIITPQASLLANRYEQDAYDEESSDAVARSVDGFDALYVQSSLGCSLGFYSTMGTTVFKPELRAHWLHEFNGDDESLSYRLIDGSGTAYNMLLQAPDSDIFKLGAGFSAKMSEYLELRADVDARLSAEYSDFTFTGSLRYQF